MVNCLCDEWLKFVETSLSCFTIYTCVICNSDWNKQHVFTQTVFCVLVIWLPLLGKRRVKREEEEEKREGENSKKGVICMKCVKRSNKE